jgi:hypothetical protein
MMLMNQINISSLFLTNYTQYQNFNQVKFNNCLNFNLNMVINCLNVKQLIKLYINNHMNLDQEV